MRILKVEPGQAPYEKEMEDTLAAIQQEVQGLFQPVYVEDGVILCCNEEASLTVWHPTGGWRRISSAARSFWWVMTTRAASAP